MSLKSKRVRAPPPEPESPSQENNEKEDKEKEDEEPKKKMRSEDSNVHIPSLSTNIARTEGTKLVWIELWCNEHGKYEWKQIDIALLRA